MASLCAIVRIQFALRAYRQNNNYAHSKSETFQ